MPTLKAEAWANLNLGERAAAKTMLLTDALQL